jgi:long-chain acyl-CoA synthetase
MPRQSLVELFQPDSRPGGEIAFVWRRGYRSIRWKYSDVLTTANRFARELESRRIGKGDRVLLWGANSGEWASAFLGCLFRGAIAVPMDAIAAPDFAKRVVQQAGVGFAVIGDGLNAETPGVPWMPLDDLADSVAHHSSASVAALETLRTDPVEIIFTSGTTAEPRGVVLTHANLLANLEPLEREIDRYRRYERFFHPLRFLDLLPLSHVFGQLLGIFLPQILGAVSVFTDSLNPVEVMRTIRDERVSLLITVPRLLESLKTHLERKLEAAGKMHKFRDDFEKGEHEKFLRRWWRFRAIHRQFGWRFWAVVSGGASLGADVEKFWSRIGYAVIQGYGLTETTSLVSVNHPFKLSEGSIGKSLPGLEVKLSDEGEILVRGENVASGYWSDSAVASVRDEEGWFHTGDLGERDASGTLFFKGRIKNVIVTPEGLNIFPGDLERELREEASVRDCVVVGTAIGGNAVPCAVLLLAEGSAEPESIVRNANSRLAAFQQIRKWVVWPETDFPRTPTQKPKLAAIRNFAEARLVGKTTPPKAAGALREILEQISPGTAARADDAAPLNLSSIERVELLSALEDRFHTELNEAQFTNVDSVVAIERLLEKPAGAATAFHYPDWPLTWPARWLRFAAWYALAVPAMRLLAWPRVSGRENLNELDGPALFVANHVTYLDPAYVLAALPLAQKQRLAIAMDGERLEGMRDGSLGANFPLRLKYRIQYWLTVAIFNVFPLPQRAGFRKSFAFAGNAVDRGWNLLVFPEGALTPDGTLAAFRPGIGLLVTRLGIPVVPMYVNGLYEMRERHTRWARDGAVSVTIGPPIRYHETESAENIAKDLQRRVAALKP